MFIQIVPEALALKCISNIIESPGNIAHSLNINTVFKYRGKLDSNCDKINVYCS